MKILIESIYVYIVCPIVVALLVGAFYSKRNKILDYWRDELQKSIEKEGQIKGSVGTLFAIIFILILIVLPLFSVLDGILYAVAGNRSALAVVVSFAVTSIISGILQSVKKDWNPHEISALVILMWMLLGLFMYYYLFPLIDIGEIGATPDILPIQQFWEVLSGYFVR